MATKRKYGATKFSDDDWMKKLEDVWDGLCFPFQCGGTVDIPDPVTVEVLSKGTFSVSPVKRPDSQYEKKKNAYWSFDKKLKKDAPEHPQVTSLKPLTDLMDAASFGHGGETLVDKDVRNALQMKGEKFTVNISPKSLGILDVIKSSLYPNISGAIRAELYSMNCYMTGGHFKKHKDTPRGDDMIGTLIIGLPSVHEGGNIHISHDGHSEQYRFSVSPENAKCLTWCAFYGDTDHEISKVKDGVRLAIAYVLRASDTDDEEKESSTVSAPQSSSSSSSSSSSGSSSSSSTDNTADSSGGDTDMDTQLVVPDNAPKDQVQLLRQTLIQAMADKEFYGEGVELAFAAYHMYTNKQAFGNEDSTTPLTPKSLKKLKGRDAVLARAAMSIPGVHVKLQPYIDGTDLDCMESAFKRFPKKFGRRVSGDDIEGHSDFYFRFEDGAPMEIEWVTDKPELQGNSMYYNRSKKVTNQGGNDLAPAVKGFGHSEFAYEGYFGNEASSTEFYVFAGIHVVIPAFDSDVRNIESLRATVQDFDAVVNVDAPKRKKRRK